MSKLWNAALNKFLKHLTRDDNNGSSYFFVDVHVSANSAQQVESASNSKIVQYRSAWDQFRKNITPSQDPLMTRYKQINHSRQGRPQIYAFGINYDGYFDKHAREFMYYLSTIKYPVDPNNRSYLPSRSRWIFHYARQIQLAIIYVQENFYFFAHLFWYEESASNYTLFGFETHNIRASYYYNSIYT